MSIFHLRITPVCRAAGENALQLAARYAGTLLIDPRTGERYDFSTQTGVVHHEILSAHEGAGYWCDQQSLWQAAELAENRKNSRVAREYQIGLPHELPERQRVDLARRWGRFLVARYQSAIDLIVRAPPADGDPCNHYAKLLATTRHCTAHGLGAKIGIELCTGEQCGPKELQFLHQQWKKFVGESLRENSIDLILEK